MKQFHTIEKRDTGMVYVLELASSINVFLLAFRDLFHYLLWCFNLFVEFYPDMCFC
jgi:hypothetical protein